MRHFELNEDFYNEPIRIDEDPQKVINTLTDINVNKFNLITSMEGGKDAKK